MAARARLVMGGALPPPGDVLYDVGDLAARIVAIREAIEAGYSGVAPTAARLLTTEAEELIEGMARQVAAGAGFEHVPVLLEEELDRL